MDTLKQVIQKPKIPSFKFLYLYFIGLYSNDNHKITQEDLNALAQICEIEFNTASYKSLLILIGDRYSNISKELTSSDPDISFINRIFAEIDDNEDIVRSYILKCLHQMYRQFKDITPSECVNQTRGFIQCLLSTQHISDEHLKNQPIKYHLRSHTLDIAKECIDGITRYNILNETEKTSLVNTYIPLIFLVLSERIPYLFTLYNAMVSNTSKQVDFNNQDLYEKHLRKIIPYVIFAILSLLYARI